MDARPLDPDDVPGSVEELTLRFERDIQEHGARSIAAALATLLDAMSEIRVDLDLVMEDIGMSKPNHHREATP